MAKKNSIRERAKKFASPRKQRKEPISEKAKAFVSLEIKYQRLKGEYIGTLKGILLWEIPAELKVKLEAQLKAIENEK